MPVPRLFTRDFTLMTVGQIISLFGNAILRFALSLHVLALTGSAAVFGGILALSMVPTALLSPLGGILADRLPRARIMVILDFSTCACILVFDALFARSGNLAAVTLFMVLLSLIQAVYQPSVQASVPALVAEDRLNAANGVVLQVQALAMSKMHFLKDLTDHMGLPVLDDHLLSVCQVYYERILALSSQPPPPEVGMPSASGSALPAQGGAHRPGP